MMPLWWSKMWSGICAIIILLPKEAALKAMEEVTAPVIAIVFVLCAVFIPVAFLGGIAGQLYRQFAMTIAISVCFSGLVALTLSPAIAALILKPNINTPRWGEKFNQFFEKITRGYLESDAKTPLTGFVRDGPLCSSVRRARVALPPYADGLYSG